MCFFSVRDRLLLIEVSSGGKTRLWAGFKFYQEASGRPLSKIVVDRGGERTV